MKKKGICFAIIMCVLSGCAKAPEVKEEQGIKFAESEKDKEIANILENAAEMESAYLTETKEGLRCICSLGDSDNVINIDATVIGADREKISVRKAKPSMSMLNKDKVMELFFSGETNVLEGNSKEKTVVKQEDGDEPVVINKMDITGEIYLESADGNIQFACTDNGLNYMNNKLIEQYKQIELADGKFKQTEGDISKDYTADMAKREFRDVFTAMTGLEIQINSCKAIYNEAGEGKYEIGFDPVVDKLPVGINRGQMDTGDNIIDVYGMAEIGKSGVSYIYAEQCLWQDNGPVSEEETDSISIEKALGILEKYLENGDVSGTEAITISRVSLTWMPVTNNWQNVELVPVWRFYIPLGETDFTAAGKAATNICINALDGKIAKIE